MKAKHLILWILFITTFKSIAQQPVAEIDFEFFKKKYVLFDANINGKTITCYFDTGSTASVLDVSLAKEIGIEPDYEQEFQGASGSQVYQIALDQKIDINNINLENIYLVLKNMQNISQKLERNVDTIIGSDILKKYILRLDFERQKILLYNQNPKVDYEGFKEIGFEFFNQIPIPQFEVGLTLKNGREFQGRVFFDSGAGLTLMINEPFSESNGLIEQVGKTLTTKVGDLTQNDLKTVNFTVENLFFSDFKFTDVPVRISSAKKGIGSYPGYLGLLGSDIIKRFDVILDYNSKKLYLKENQLFKTEFKYPLSGVILRSKNKEIVVEQVAVESEAYKNGLRVGAVIKSINGNETLNLSQCRNLLSQEGEKINLKVIQQGKRETIEFEVRRQI